jgi:hypothetical protein
MIAAANGASEDDICLLIKVTKNALCFAQSLIQYTRLVLIL